MPSVVDCCGTVHFVSLSLALFFKNIIQQWIHVQNNRNIVIKKTSTDQGVA